MLLAAILAACSQQSPSSEAPAPADSEIANQSVETAEKLGTAGEMKYSLPFIP